MTKKYTFIDLFAGAGGLSEGFVRAGFTPIAHIEMDKYACETLKTRAAYHYLDENNRLDIYKKYLLEKKEGENGQKLWSQVPAPIIDSVIHATIGSATIDGIFQKVDILKGKNGVDLIIGGPPCQAYSIAGRSRMGKDVEKDPRNELYKYYVRFLERYTPKMFVFENVLGIKTAKQGEPLKDLQELVASAGYEMKMEVQNASEHGVLQRRQRVIIVGWRKDILNSKGEKHFYPILEKECNSYTVMNDLFSDLPIRKAGEGSLTAPVHYSKDLNDMPYLKESAIRNEKVDFTTQHIARPHNANDREIYCMAIKQWREKRKQLDYSKLPAHLQTHKNTKSFLDRYSVVDPDGYSHTVVAHISKDGHYYIYPTTNPTIENVRSITVREAARLQSFPDDYFFEGNRGAAFKQIGNAVPVLLAFKIAKEILKQL
ncbi:MAG: DNA cytosine methyltransferase [Bacteroidales bacterium]|nr:DNA cytosine methyltransferase [Bacteroidales bacterium]